MMCMGLNLGIIMKMINVFILAGVGYLVMLFASKDQRKVTRTVGRVMGIVMMIVALALIVNMILKSGGAGSLESIKSILPTMSK